MTKVALRFVVAALFLGLVGFLVYWFAFRLSNEEMVSNAVVEYKFQRERSDLDANMNQLENLGFSNSVENSVQIDDNRYKAYHALVIKNSADYGNDYSYYDVLNSCDEILDYYYVASRVVVNVSGGAAKEINNCSVNLVNKTKELSKQVKLVFNNQKSLVLNNDKNGFVKDDGRLEALVNQFANLERMFREYIQLFSKFNMALENLILENVYDNGSYFSEVGALTQFTNYTIKELAFPTDEYTNIINDYEKINTVVCGNLNKVAKSTATLLEKKNTAQSENVGLIMSNYNIVKSFDKANEQNTFENLLKKDYNEIINGKYADIVNSSVLTNVDTIVKTVFNAKFDR